MNAYTMAGPQSAQGRTHQDRKLQSALGFEAGGRLGPGVLSSALSGDVSLETPRSPVTQALCSLCLSGSCGRSCKNMVQKYQPPVGVYKYPFELVMALVVQMFRDSVQPHQWNRSGKARLKPEICCS
ncbi:SEC14-like protein 1 [Manis javanica]|nr:SEC14-like protein 1 [Manis javanica]